MLNAARKRFEGVKSNVPHFYERNQMQSNLKHLKAVIRKRKGGGVNEKAMERQKAKSKIEVENINVAEMKLEFQNIQQRWEEKKKKEVKRKEEEMLELHPHDTIGEDPSAMKQREKTLQSLKQDQCQKSTFNLLLKGVGKGMKILLKRIPNEQG